MLYHVTDEELTERWDGSAWTHYAGQRRGTSFPVSGLVAGVTTYFRTDIHGRTLFRYDGTRWLSEQLLRMQWGCLSKITTTSNTEFFATHAASGFDMWLEEIGVTGYLASGDGSDYFSIDLYHKKAANTDVAQGLTSFDTTAWASASYDTVKKTIGAALSTLALTLYLKYTAVGSPGGFYPMPYLLYRLIAT